MAFEVVVPENYPTFALSCSGLDYIYYEFPAGGDHATSLTINRSYNNNPYRKNGSSSIIDMGSYIAILQGNSPVKRTGKIETNGCDILYIHIENMQNVKFYSMP